MIMNCLLLLYLSVGLASAQSNWHAPNCEGNRRAIVHLFEWKWTNIADECESFLGPRGFCGVQVSPPNENAVIDNESEPKRPWWERYQPVSYLLETRSGNLAEFTDMVQRCNNVGVRIYVDAIINHMTGMGRAGVGTGGTEYDADAGSFPGVPYVMDNFNGCDTCPSCCCINSWTDHAMVRDCRLVGLIDLDQANTDSASKIAGYMNMLTGLGVAGFRIDAAKHMWPADIEALWGSLDTLNPTWFPAGSNPFLYLEVIDMNQNGEVNVHEYTHLGRVTEFRFCSKVREAAGGLWSIPGIYDPGWGMCEPGDAFVFVDNHDNQRGHGSGGEVLTHKDPTPYKMAQAISLGWDYGYQRIMSSFDFGDDTDTGPPHDGDYNINDVTYDADGQCTGGWVCEHRWNAIAGMAGWAKATNGEPVENWWNEGNKAAWNKGTKGFVAMTNEGGLDVNRPTGLPAGDYCNVIQGCATDTGCEDGVDVVTVASDGTAQISITDTENPILAIHAEAMAGSGQCVTV